MTPERCRCRRQPSEPQGGPGRTPGARQRAATEVHPPRQRARGHGRGDRAVSTNATVAVVVVSAHRAQVERRAEQLPLDHGPRPRGILGSDERDDPRHVRRRPSRCLPPQGSLRRARSRRSGSRVPRCPPRARSWRSPSGHRADRSPPLRSHWCPPPDSTRRLSPRSRWPRPRRSPSDRVLDRGIRSPNCTAESPATG